MPGRRKMDKEVTAMAHNVKEKRCLEKSMHTLDLEKTYSMKLINLDHRGIKLSYKRLKDKVSKIKSHLSTDEIVTLKQLEADGKLKNTSNTVNLGSALKIAAAAKRLKLQSAPRPVTSVLPQLSTRENTEVSFSRHQTLPFSLRRSNSVTGVFIDAPEPNKDERRNSISGPSIRPFSVAHVQNLNNQSDDENKLERAITANPIIREKSILRNETKTQRGKSAMPSHSPYSSHSAMEKEQRNNPPSGEAKTPFLTDDIESNLGEDLFEERRQELLEEEKHFYQDIENKTKGFLTRLQEYLKANPIAKLDEEEIPITNISDALDVPQNVEERIQSAGQQKRKRLLSHRTPLEMRSFPNDEAYQKKLGELWKDMYKCRYLRIPDDRIDLSGIVTLAKDQMRLYSFLRETEADKLM